MSASEPSPERTPPQSSRPRPRRRPARRRGFWQSRWPATIGLGLLAVLLLLLVVAQQVWQRADAALATIQQDDPRQRATAAPSVAAAPSAVDAALPTATPRAGIPVPTSGLPGSTLNAPINILLIGVDRRPDPDEGVRSDTLILLRLDPINTWAAMLSIPRDTVATIPHLGQAKINSAYGHGYKYAADIYGAGTEPDAGGGALAAETVEDYLGVTVDYVAEVDFRGFSQLVDTVGGVLVDVPRPLLDAEYPTDEGYGVERIYIPAGLQLMDGRTALIYARSRHSSSDFERSKRQQQVLSAVLTQVKARGLLENAGLITQWAQVLQQNIRTTLPVRDLGTLGGLAQLARELDSDKILQLSINPNDVAVDGEYGSDIYWNKRDVAALVATFMAGPAGASARVQVLNGTGVVGIATQVTEHLRQQGFVLDDPSTAPETYQRTTIIDYTGKPDTRERLADVLGLSAANIQIATAGNAPPSDADVVIVVGQDYRQEWTK